MRIEIICIKISHLFVAAVMSMTFTLSGMADEGKHFVSLVWGRSTEKDLQALATFDYHGFVDSEIMLVSVGKEVKEFKAPLRLEVEGQIGKHWGYQKHWETNAALVLRWLKFPWDRHVDSSFAIGDGISYASEDPQIEVDKLGRTSKILNYLLLELECAIPDQDKWSVFMRIHHRSGIYGLIDGVSGGSNMLTGGVRLRF